MSTDKAYVYIGAFENAVNVPIPYPTEGGAPFSCERRYKTATNANGEIVGQQIGEPTITASFGWDLIKADLWWGINRFFETNGDVCWCKFFNHNLGRWETKRFWRQPTECNPVLVCGATGEPAYYEGAKFDLISTGE